MLSTRWLVWTCEFSRSADWNKEMQMPTKTYKIFSITRVCVYGDCFSYGLGERPKEAIVIISVTHKNISGTWCIIWHWTKWNWESFWIAGVASVLWRICQQFIFQLWLIWRSKSLNPHMRTREIAYTIISYCQLYARTLLGDIKMATPLVDVGPHKVYSVIQKNRKLGTSYVHLPLYANGSILRLPIPVINWKYLGDKNKNNEVSWLWHNQWC